MKRLLVVFVIISLLILNISYNSSGIFNISFKNIVMATGNDDMNMSMDMSKDNTVDKGHDDAMEGHGNGGHSEEAGNNSGPNLIFLIMLGNIIVLSIVIAAVIKHRREMLYSGTSN